MKNGLSILAMALCGMAASTALGQTTYIWTGGGDGTNVDLAANWGGTLPATASSDTGEFNGSPSGNLALIYNIGNFASGYGQSGVNFYLTASQTGSVSIDTTLATSPALAITGITIDSGAGALTLGGTNTAKLLYIIGRPSGAVHSFVNNSANTALINPRVQWKAGGGTAYTLDFSGSGNWQCNNYLNSDNSSAVTVAVDGPGTLTWNPTGYLGADNFNGININSGKLVLTGSHPRLVNRSILDAAIFEFNAPAQAQTFNGIISGAGELRVSNGTLTLAAQNTYAGNTTLNGGEVIVSSAENAGTSGPLGTGGVISFGGGTLGYSVNNLFDYSSRFSTASGQAYSIDTAGQNVTFTNATGLTSSGGTLTKLGSGALTLAGANTYSGNTIIGAGKLIFQGTMSGSGSITVSNSAALGVTENGSQITPATLKVGTSASATLEFNNVTSTTTAPLVAGSVSAGGTITINVNSGAFTIGQSYPLLAWTSGAAPAVALGTLTGAGGSLSTNGNTIQLNVTSIAYVWTGLNNGNWDMTTANNWKVNGSAAPFQNGGTALFDDTAAGTTNVTLNAAVSPGSLTVNNNTKIYTLTSSGANLITGTGGLTKSGNNALYLSGGVNTYSGATTIGGGLVSVGTLANGGVASDLGAAANGAANLVFNGGTLRYTGGAASSDHLFTLSTAGGAIDASGSGALVLNNAGTIALTGTGARTLTLTGSDASGDTLAARIGDNGGATALTKTGSGTWILTGNNTNTGTTTIAAGELQIGIGGTNGALGSGNIVDNGSLDINVSNTMTLSGTLSGTGSLTNDGSGTLILPANNTYSGGTTINAGTLQIGTGGATGALNSSSPIVDNGTLIFNSTSTIILAGFGANITGTGNLIARGPALVKTIGANSYTGWTEIDSGATFQPCEGNTGQLLSSVVTNNGTLLFTRQDGNPAAFGYSNNIVGSGKVVKDNNNQNAGWVVLAGTNTYTGGTFIAGGSIVLGDGLTPGAGVVVGPVVFTNTAGVFLNPRSLVFNRADDFTFTNDIITSVTDGSSAANSGALEQAGPGAVTLTGNCSYPGTTTIDSGMVLQVGAGGTNGSIGSGSVANSGTLVCKRSDNMAISSVISGSGSLVQQGPGTLTLSAANTYAGATIVSNGTLVVTGGSVAGNLDAYGGTLLPAAAGSIGTLNVAGSMDISSGTVVATLNKSLSPSNSLFSVSGSLTHSGGGKLQVVNAGPSLVVGDTFVLFSQAVSSGASMTIIPPANTTFANNLAVDGSITVLTVPTTVTTPTNLVTSITGNQLILSWPSDHTGWHLQVQTDSLAKGLGTNWYTIPGSDAGNRYTNTFGSTNGSVYFRMVYP